MDSDLKVCGQCVKCWISRGDGDQAPTIVMSHDTAAPWLSPTRARPQLAALARCWWLHWKYQRWALTTDSVAATAGAGSRLFMMRCIYATYMFETFIYSRNLLKIEIYAWYIDWYGHKIYHTVNCLRSFLSLGRSVSGSFSHSVIRSHGIKVTRSLGHSVTRFGHSVTQSLGHSVTQSIGHSVTRFSFFFSTLLLTNGLTNTQH